MFIHTITNATRWGNITSLCGDNYITTSLVVLGESCGNALELCIPLIRRGDVVLDIGANIGTFAVPFGRSVGKTGKVIAFEPQQPPYLCLCTNIVQNSLTKIVQPLQMAIGKESGTIGFDQIDVESHGNFGGSRSNPTGPIQVALGTIDELGLPRINFMKIDVEGMEADVIRGATESIKKFQPILFLEALDEMPESAVLLKELGYTVLRTTTALWRPNNARMSEENPFPDIVTDDLLAFPKSMPVPKGLEEAKVL